jgi:DNA-binding NarL/FixJ family response regulator
LTTNVLRTKVRIKEVVKMKHIDGRSLIRDTFAGEISESALDTLADVVEGLSVSDSATRSYISESGIKQRRALAYEEVGVANSHELLLRVIESLA